MCGKTGFLRLLPPLIALSIVRRIRYLTTYCMVLINVCLTILSLSARELNVITRVHATVRDKLQASRSEIIYRQHKQAHPIFIMVGDTIMKAVPDRHSKLSTKFTGPFLVVEKFHGNKFKLLDTS